MKFFFFLLFLLSINLNVSSQSKEIIYVNENFEKIDFETYTKRLNSKLFLTSLVENDTTVLKKLRFKEYFGNLGKKKSQLNKLYQRRYSIDSAKIWLIHYIDSLPNVTKMPQKSSMLLIDSEGQEVLISNSEYSRLYNQQLRKCATHDSIIYKGNTVTLGGRHNHISSYSDYKKNTLKEISSFKKHKKVSLYHFYNFNKGFPIHEINNFWIKDENQILKNTFSDGQLQYKFLLIHPNGDFYASHYFKFLSEQNKLLKYKFFKRAERKWLKRVKKL